MKYCCKLTISWDVYKAVNDTYLTGVLSTIVNIGTLLVGD